MKIADKITITRIAIAEVGFIFLILGYFRIGLALFLSAVVLDIIDGRVARFSKQDSREGMLIDVMADKIIVISAFLTVGVKISFVFFYLGLLILLRESLVDTMRSITISRGKIAATDKFSKAKYILYLASVLALLINSSFLSGNLYIKQIIVGFAGLVIIFAYVTLVRFFILNRNNIYE